MGIPSRDIRWPSRKLALHVTALGCAIAACARPTPPPVFAPALPARERLVLVISLDGLPAYAFEDPRMPAPALRRLAREGAAATAMTIVNPAVTWPNHTTLATGVSPLRHGVLFNGRLLRPGPRAPVRVEHRDRADLVRAPTLYDRAHQAGLSTAQVDWVPHQIDGTISWAFPERPALGGPIERQLVGGGFLTEDDLGEFRRTTITWRDQIWTDAAAYLVARHRPNLLYLHLLALDATHHNYGPWSLASASGIALADARVAQLLETVAAEGLATRTTVFVVSDHGFKQVFHEIQPNVALRAAGLIEVTGTTATACDVWSISEGGTAMVYLTNPDPRRREELLARARETLAALEGVARVVDPPQYAALGLPTPAENDQMADLVLVAKHGYHFTNAFEGAPLVARPEGAPLGAHGYLAEDPQMNAVFIAWGYGIRPGARVGTIRNVDVAPTVAAVLGVGLPGAEGRALREILK